MNKRFFLFALLLYACAVTAQTSFSRAEYWIDTDPGHGKATAAILSGNEVTADISTASLSEGWHTLGLRASGGSNWSTTFTRLFFVPNEECSAIGQLTGLEYFIDNDPGAGNAVAIPFSATQKSFALSLTQTDTLKHGLHTLGIRARNGYLWSNPQISYFATVDANLETDELTAVEYWLDEDPGQGEATPIPFSKGQTDFALNLQQMDTLPEGIHMIGLRVRKGPIWSETYTKSFVNAVLHTPMEVSAVEAYWDGDTTKIIKLPYSQVDGHYEISTTLSTEHLSYGVHTLSFYAVGDGIRSHVKSYEVCKNVVPQFTILDEENICVNQEVIILNETQDVQPETTFAWDMNGDGKAEYTDKGDIVHTFTQAGKYTVSLTAQTGEGCETVYSREIYVHPTSAPSVSISRSKSSICAGESVTFTATPTNGGQHPIYQWFRNDNEIAGAVESQLLLDDLQNGDRIKVQLTADNPCATVKTAMSSVLMQTVYDLPEIRFSFAAVYYTDDNAFSLTNMATPTGGTFYINDVETKLFNPKNNPVGTYHVRYVVSNSNNCTAVAETTFELKDRDPEPELPYVALIGEMNNWDGGVNQLIPADDGKTATAKVELALNDNSGYAFKILVGPIGLSARGTDGKYGIHRGWTSAKLDWVDVNSEPLWLTMDVAGEYTFTFSFEDSVLTVGFPEKGNPEQENDTLVVNLKSATEIAYTGCSATPSVTDDVLTVNYTSGGWQWAGVEFPLDNITDVINITFDYKGDGENVVIYPYLRDSEGVRWTKSNCWLNLSVTDWLSVTTYLPDVPLWDAADYAFGKKPFVKLGFVVNPGTATEGTFYLRNLKIEYKVTLEPTDIDIVSGKSSSITQKILRNGQILILRGERVYTVTGQEVR